MIEVAKKLSEGFPFVRVDLYFTQNIIYFGEMTFFQKLDSVNLYLKNMTRFLVNN